MIFLVIAAAGLIMIYEKFIRKHDGLDVDEGEKDTEKFIGKHRGLSDSVEDVKDTTDAKAKAAEEGVTFTQVALTNEMTAEENEMTAEEKADQAAQAKWLTPSNENP